MTALPNPSLAEAAERLERDAPGYLDRVRALAAQLGLPASPAERAARSIELVDDAARVDADAPTHSDKASGRFLKTGVGRLVRWYMLYMASEVSNLGSSASWMGRALFDYTAGLESEVLRLRSELEQLRSRVEDLEQSA